MEIKIRKANSKDAQGIANIFKESLKKGVLEYTSLNEYGKKKTDDLKKKLSNKNSSAKFFIAINENNKIIGNCSYTFSKKGRLRHRVGLGWAIHPDFRGKGVATKLLNFALNDAKKKGFKRAEAEIVTKNIASYKIAMKNGFRIEGTKKKAFITDNGKFEDTYIVGKLL